MQVERQVREFRWKMMVMARGGVGRGGRESRSECGQINRRPQRLAVGGEEKMGSRTIPRFLA